MRRKIILSIFWLLLVVGVGGLMVLQERGMLAPGQQESGLLVVLGLALVGVTKGNRK